MLRKNESTTTDYNCMERWFSQEELFIEHVLSANDVIDVWALWCTLLRIPYEGDFGTRKHAWDESTFFGNVNSLHSTHHCPRKNPVILRVTRAFDGPFYPHISRRYLWPFTKTFYWKNALSLGDLAKPGVSSRGWQIFDIIYAYKHPKIAVQGNIGKELLGSLGYIKSIHFSHIGRFWSQTTKNPKKKSTLIWLPSPYFAAQKASFPNLIIWNPRTSMSFWRWTHSGDLCKPRFPTPGSLELSSLKLTANAPENTRGPKRKFIFQPSIFRGHVSFREGKLIFGRIPILV